MAESSLTVTDNRTNKTFKVPIKDSAIDATEFRQADLKLYDPGFMNTACARSSISFIDGEKGILTYRGYPIEELAEKSNFLEVAFLIIHGSLPSQEEYNDWNEKIMNHNYLHENLVSLLKTFRYDAHPMGMIVSGIAALGTFYPEANPALAGPDVYQKEENRNKQIYRLLGKVPTLVACAWRHRMGRPYTVPQSGLSYCENFLYMLDHQEDSTLGDYRPHPTLVKALDILFMLHAEHELNCSTAALRHLSSAGGDVYTAVAGAAGALYGPSHGGANEAVLAMLQRIGSVENVAPFLLRVKERKEKLMGFGHRIYKTFDPRAQIIRKIAYDVFAVVGKQPLIDVAIALEEAALSDEFFRSRRLYPNVDFFTGLIYSAMGFPKDMFPVLFTIPRVVGWLAHWNESLQTTPVRIWRPLQIYVGPQLRHFVPITERKKAEANLLCSSSGANRRRSVSLLRMRAAL